MAKVVVAMRTTTAQLSVLCSLRVESLKFEESLQSAWFAVRAPVAGRFCGFFHAEGECDSGAGKAYCWLWEGLGQPRSLLCRDPVPPLSRQRDLILARLSSG